MQNLNNLHKYIKYIQKTTNPVSNNYFVIIYTIYQDNIETKQRKIRFI